jgi:hypothetical protein
MVDYLRSLMVAIVFLFVAVAAYPQDDSSDTSGAQATIQAITNSAQTPTQAPPQAYPALKAQYCRAAVAYVDNELPKTWDKEMGKYTAYRSGFKQTEQIRKELLSNDWRTGTLADMANDVRLVCQMTNDVLALLSPGGSALKTGIAISEEFGAKVSRRAIRTYELLEKGEDALAAKDALGGTDELALWAVKGEAARAGLGRVVAGVNLLQDMAEHDKIEQEATEYKRVVQERVRALNDAISSFENGMAAERDRLVAIQALTDAVYAACNKGEPTQQVPEFAKGYVVQEPNQSVQPNSGLPATQSGLPWWWATLGSIPISSVRRTTQANPTQGKPTPSSSQPGSSYCGPLANNKICQ